MRRIATMMVTLIAVGCQTPEPSSGASAATDVASVFDGSSGSWVDLTHSFSEASVYWPTDTVGFTHEELAYGPTDGGWFYASYRYSAAEHGGTHLDAPIHFAEGRQTSEQIPLSSLIGPAAVVDVAERAHPDYLISVEDFTSWEEEHGQIPEAGFVVGLAYLIPQWVGAPGVLEASSCAPPGALILRLSNRRTRSSSRLPS